jgi:hypothetical protein
VIDDLPGRLPLVARHERPLLAGVRHGNDRRPLLERRAADVEEPRERLDGAVGRGRGLHRHPEERAASVSGSPRATTSDSRSDPVGAGAGSGSCSIVRQFLSPVRGSILAICSAGMDVYRPILRSTFPLPSLNGGFPSNRSLRRSPAYRTSPSTTTPDAVLTDATIGSSASWLV